ncbi:hypothetical protein INS49_003124 [Diaporthe citri]|uniref:uncharacterized protein n=1 Tax=Diaporthe citri TaxID=83186 RepID=UPI001C8270FC|nr:uncharacterized protein INS49_003124 [Diaporthe citri]KAG6368906.1 hypothetical protein INS49_003124 [Diaporthe citri]
MSGRSRKKPEDDSSEEDVDQSPEFSDSASGKFRGRVQAYASPADFPQEPLYKVRQIVYLAVPGQSQPAGPYVVVSA